MTAHQIDDQEVGFALSALWERHRETNLERVSIVEETAAAVVRGSLSDDARNEGVSAAHKLAGSLGTFGFEAGSGIALQVEAMLKDAASDPRALAEAVGELRSAIDETPAGDDEPEEAPETPAAAPAPTHVDVILASDDSELSARMTTAAAGAGMACEAVSIASLDVGAAPLPDQASLLMVDEAGLNTAELTAIVERLTPTISVAVLTSTDTFSERIQLARAGVVAAIPRTQAAGIAMEFAASVMATGQASTWRIRVLGDNPELVEALQDAGDDLDGDFAFYDDGADLWEALESEGADLVILDSERHGDMIADLCRVIRTDPSHRWIPIVAFGLPDDDQLRAAIDAGLDNILHPAIGPNEVRARLRVLLRRSESDRAAAELDRLTGVENRDTVERSLDRLLRLSTRHGEPFALARITVDQFDKIGREQGAVAGDLILQYLAGALQDSVRAGDTVGRWSTDGLILGFGRTDRTSAEDRLGPILERIQDHELIGPAGRPVRFEIRSHIAATPIDGTTLASLERTCDYALAPVGKAGEARKMPTPATVDGRQVDVVLVEDDDSIADVVEYALDLRGYRLERFVDGAEAAGALTSGEVVGRVVLLDVGLPSLDGFGVLRRLGAEGVLDRSHLIMLTARSSENERLRALELGATEHIPKPFSVPVLLGRLDQVLTGAQR